MKKLLPLFLMVPLFASSMGDNGLPFTPVRASQQAQLTSVSLHEEFDQYQALAKSLENEFKYEVAQRKFVQAKKSLERAQRLLKAGAFTESRLGRIYYEYRQLESEVINLPVEIAKAKLAAEFHKWRLLEAGNPGARHESELVEILIQGMDSELQTLATSRKLALTAIELAQQYLESGQELMRRNAISEEQLELREVGHKNALAQLRSLERQAELVQSARASFEESQNRLRAPAK